MPRAAVFSTNYLDYSQTFVHEEVTHHRRYDIEVFARARRNEERFPFAPVHVGGMIYGITRYSLGFMRRFRAARFDVVHGHFGTGSLYALPYAKMFDLPLLVTFHGYDVPLVRSSARFWPPHWPYALLARRLLARMTLGLCASQELLEMLSEYGVPREKLRLHRLGVDVARFAAAKRRVSRVLMVGRFVEKKGFAYGIRAFAQATVERHQEFELCIVGSGDLEPTLRALVSELGITRRVRFAGALPSTEVAALMSESAVLMAPSVVASDGDRESGVIVLKEASASGCAVLGTYHGGIPEIIDDGVTGFLVPERDTRSLGRALERLLADPALRDDFARAGRLKMEREYELSQRVDELEQHYDEASALHRR